MRPALWLLVLICWALPELVRASDEPSAWRESLTLSGWVDAIQSVRVSSPHDGVTSRARLRLELAADLDQVYGFISVDAEKNFQIDEETGVELHEAWLEYSADQWDLRIGRQIIIWGKADGVQITDLISPPDYTESMTRDLDEIRMPVDALKFRLLGQAIDTELIWIPVFKAALLPSGDNPWAVEQVVPENTLVSSDPTDEPETSLENSELALKVSAYLSGLDVAASVFYTWDDYPAMHRSFQWNGQTADVNFSPRHHRLTVFGLSFSWPWSDFVFRGEAAYSLGMYRSAAAIDIDPIQKESLEWLGGLDWNPGNDWTFSVQLTGDAIMDYEALLADESHDCMATLNVSKKLLNQVLTLSNMLYYTINDNEAYNRSAAQYALTDSLHLYVGTDIFLGEDGGFGVYQDNTQVWVKVKYLF